MPYLPSCLASRSNRAACASVRTGMGPSFAAIPPTSPRVTRTVFAPNSAARSAATRPAGPAPTITTSIRTLLVCLVGSRRYSFRTAWLLFHLLQPLLHHHHLLLP